MVAKKEKMLARARARERERDSKQSFNILYHEMIGNDRK